MYPFPNLLPVTLYTALSSPQVAIYLLTMGFGAKNDDRCAGTNWNRRIQVNPCPLALAHRSTSRCPISSASMCTCPLQHHQVAALHCT
jgi:hypothetical protein